MDITTLTEQYENNITKQIYLFCLQIGLLNCWFGFMAYEPFWVINAKSILYI